MNTSVCRMVLDLKSHQLGIQDIQCLEGIAWKCYVSGDRKCQLLVPVEKRSNNPFLPQF